MKTNFAILLKLIITAMLHGHVISQPVPEDVVWTTPRIAFWEGQQMASLPCLFRGEPIAVYWKKGATVDTAEDLIVWHNQQKSGTRFDDGSVDILVSQNYSLLFKQPVDFNVAGQYICRVSNYKAELHANSTMVTVREFQVQTTQRLTVWKGEITSLPCGLPYPPYRVQWVNESSGKVVANYIDGTFHPPSGGNSRYRMEEDFSLTISEVSVLDEATLTCEVFAYDSKSWRNSTVLTVNARGSHPTFDSCEGAMHCTRVVNSREFQLSCTVRGAKPDVTMSLTATRNSYVMLLPKLFKGRGDGTRDQTIYANVSISSESSSEKFTCSARGEAVQGIANATITVTVKSGAGGLSEVAIIVIIAITLIVLGLVCFLVFKLTRKKRVDGHKGAASNEPLEKLRTQIQSYKPGDATESKLNVEKVNLGLFGVMSTGKSAFINAVMFALTGEYHKHADDTTDGLMADGSNTKENTPYHLTSNITLFDNRGLVDYSDDTAKYLDQFRYNISQRIHCPILVADARMPTATTELNGFLNEFPSEVEKLYGVKMKYVFTHKTVMESNGRDPRKLFRIIPEEDMILVENYTQENNKEDVERSTELLKFILSCLERAKCNIESMDRKEKERKEEQLRNDMQFAPAASH